MAQSTIEWTDYTFNPWEGCEKVSPGCKFCYADRRDSWLHPDERHWGPGSGRLEHGDSYWSKPLHWQRRAAAGGYTARVFCGSLCDILERRAVPGLSLRRRGAYQAFPGDAWLSRLRARTFALATDTPNLIWLFLTKRPENAFELFPPEWREAWPVNVMFGFTAEDQDHYSRRNSEHWRYFARYVKGLRTFVSCEPLLGPIDLDLEDCAGKDWVIAGGESGPNARPMHPDWARSLRDQCAAAGVPFLFKQWGAWGPFGQAGAGMANALVQVGKKAAGRSLDGEEHNGLPLYWPANVGLPTKSL